jgi:glycine/D-amino acid oxidase-like deaminating enzyme/nitrite reductase/ring-hydroxylating ferredoxin subunit
MLPKESQSFWLETETKSFPKVSKADRYNVVIVGGGITGLTTAWLLKKAGKSVCVLERDRIAHGDTGYTTAHLSMVSDLRLKDLVDTFGKESATRVWQGGAIAVDTIESIVDQLKIACDFRRVPSYVHAPVDSLNEDSDALRKETELAVELGFEADYVENAPIVNRPAVCYPNQALFHPVKYLNALATAVHGDGCAVYEESEAKGFETDPQRIIVNDVEILYDKLVVATHVPLMGNKGLLGATLFQTKLYSYSSYVVAGEAPRDKLIDVSLYDTADPYRYLRIDTASEVARVVFGGEDHKTGQAQDIEDRYRRLGALLVQIIPELKIDTRWSGQVVETNDGLPFIGESTLNQFVATGYAGNGMTFGTLASLMARDWVLAQENPWQDLFSVDRKKLRGGTWHYLKENIDYPYYLVRDWLSSTRKDEASSLKPGEGAIFKIDGHQAACSRDNNGTLHTVSAICTHMGCIVHWNAGEQTWDCPCHGSRFHCDGKMLAGPAETPLETLGSTPKE